MVSALALSLLAGAFAATLLIEYFILRLSRRMNLVAIPNERSFHRTPTPTIGGLAIVSVVFGYLGYGYLIADAPVAGILISGALLAVVGLWDDLKELGPGIRFASHVIAVIVLLAFMELDWHPLLMLVVGLLILWHINLYNFMDGIDGIAGAQALLFCVGTVLIGGAGTHGGIDQLG